MVIAINCDLSFPDLIGESRDAIVMNETFYSCYTKEIRVFEEKVRSESLLCQLSLQDRKIDWEILDRNSNLPFAFLAYLKGYLSRLDEILGKFKTEKGYKKDFSERLVDRCFFENDKNKELNQLNSFISPIVELVVADYLSNNGEEITQLDAWSDCKSDIKSKSKDRSMEYYTEVKYLGQRPEQYRLIQDIISRNNVTGFNCTGGIGEIYNYVNSRIADAVFQLEKMKILFSQRRVFIVMEDSINSIITNLRNKTNWSDLSWGSLANKLKWSQGDSNRYLEDTVENYHRRAGQLVIAFLSNSYTLNKTEYLETQNRQ